MRRWLLILLLTVLPWQFASAAAASYCRHEAGVAKHFGHHEHQHQAGEHQPASGSPDSGSPENTGGGGDPDCEYCHLGAAHPLLQDFSQPGGSLEALPVTHPVLSFGTRDPDTLDRPNWALA